MSDKEVTSIEQEIGQTLQQIMAARERLAGLRREWSEIAGEVVPEYAFSTAEGESVLLSELFGDHDDLIVVHNMGRGCAYCTLWADGFVGLLPHIERRTAFVVSTPDEPAVQRAFAASRGWPFRMVSVAGTSFAKDMGFMQGDDYWPGFSTFRREADGAIRRVGKDFFGPGDDYCSVWHLFDHLANGTAGWQPAI